MKKDGVEFFIRKDPPIPLAGNFNLFKPKLKLPNVTLVMIETLEHELARLAVNECMNKAEFAEILIFTDKPSYFFMAENNVRFIDVPCWPNKIGWSKSSWYDVPPHLHTSHALYIQWDSWIWDPECWTDDFLQFDLIGAPWPWHPDRKVGNLGFGMRSTQLARFMLKNRERFPCSSELDDDLLCRKYRLDLEDAGFVWAPESLAERFAFECAEPDLERKHFGFHACQNFKYVLSQEDLIERANLMRESPYIGKKDSYMWKNFVKANPGLEHVETTRSA